MNCLDAPACEHFVRMVMVFVFMVVMMFFMVVIVTAARAVRSMIVVMLVVMVSVLLVIVVMLVVMMMMLVIMVLMMHMRNQLHHLFLQIVSLLQRSLDHITRKFVPLRCHDSRFLILFTKQLDAFL